MKNLPKRSLLFQDSRLFACVILEHCMNPAMCWWMCDKWPLKTTKMLVRAEACKFTDGSPPGLSIHGILQARILEWAALPFSRKAPPRSPELPADSLPTELSRKP